jgi:rod shape-determining protein MreD
MVRAALQPRGRLNRGPRPGVTVIPAASVVALSMLALLPVMADRGGWPDFGFLMLIAWRLLRADAWPAWWAAPLGFVNDLLTASPIGLSVALWTFVMLVMDLIDRRTQWRDYWIEWALAAVLILLGELAEWKVAGWSGAPVPFTQMLPSIVVSILAFPLFAHIASTLDRWRLGQ